MGDRFIMGVENKHYYGAAHFFSEAAESFKLTKSWYQVRATYVKLANCYFKTNNKQLAAYVYSDAARFYKKKKTNIKEAISSLEKAIDIFLEFGKSQTCAKYYREIAEMYEEEQDLEQASVNYKNAADLYQSEDIKASALICTEKIAQCAALLGKYKEASEIFEGIAGDSTYRIYYFGVNGHLLNAGICQLCMDNVVFNDVLKKYQKIDPDFLKTYLYKILVRLAVARDKKDKVMFSDAVEDYKSFSMRNLEAWKTTLLSRVAEAIKEDNFT